MEKSRHNVDRIVYLCGDHSDPETFYYAERNITLATDYSVINPTKGEQTYSLLERLDILGYADVVVLISPEASSYDLAAVTEFAYANAVGIDVMSYEEFLEPYEIVRDCD